MALDSDVPNADANLHVEFFIYKALDTKRWPNKDAAALEDSYDGKPFLRVIIPGEMHNIPARPVRESDKERFPRHWLNYMRQISGDDIPGIKLAQWRSDSPNDLTESMLDTLGMLKFSVVEQVAGASDGQIMRIGMGGDGLRTRAQQYLRSKSGGNASNAEMNALKNELAEMRKLLAERPQQAAPKSKGWPKGKPRKPVNVNNDNAATHAAGDQ